MKCIQILLLSLLFTSIINAQEWEVDTLRYSEVGIGFNFINNFIPTDNNVGEESPFQFYFNNWKGNSVKRVALGFDIDGSVMKLDDGERTRKVNDISTSIRFGSGKRKDISNRFKFIGGSDFLLGFDYSSVKIEDDGSPQFDNSFKTSFVEFGGGIFGGVQFYITSKLSLYTEMSYMVVIDYESSKLDWKSDSRDDEKDTEFGYGTRYTAPSYLVLFYRF